MTTVPQSPCPARCGCQKVSDTNRTDVIKEPRAHTHSPSLSGTHCLRLTQLGAPVFAKFFTAHFLCNAAKLLHIQGLANIKNVLMVFIQNTVIIEVKLVLH